MASGLELRTLLACSNMLGLGPFCIWRDGNLFPKPNALPYSILAVFVLCTLQSLVLLDKSGTAARAPSPAADLIDTYGFAITCIGAFLVHIRLETRLGHLYNTLLQISPAPTSTGSSRPIIIDIGFCIVYEVSFSIISILAIPFEFGNFYFYVLETFTYVALETYNYLIFLQFVYIVMVCKSAFKSINEKLERLKKEILAHRGNHDKRRGFVNVLQCMSGRHSDIVTVSESVNQLFALQNILIIFLIFLEITYAFYNAVLNIGIQGGPTYPSSLLSDMLLWAGYFIYKLIVIVKVCSYTVHESEITFELIQSLTFLVDDDDDACLNEQIECFSLQLLHNKPCFHALGFFTLDMTLMYSIIASATGYLIILIQFANVPDE